MDKPQAVALQMDRFLPILCALVFFGFFGFSEEVRGLYSNIVVALVKECKKATWARDLCLRLKTRFMPSMDEEK